MVSGEWGMMSGEWGMVVGEWGMVNAKCVRLPPSKILGEWGIGNENGILQGITKYGFLKNRIFGDFFDDFLILSI